MGLDSNRYAPSILQEDVGTRCFICDREHIELVRHEIYQGVGRRKKCKRLGLWITVCVSCHNNLHANPSGADARYLDEYAERAALEFYGWTIPKFIREIGKNYISSFIEWKIDGGELRPVDDDERFTSIDEKPIVGVPDGVFIREDDTGDIYFFNADKKLWICSIDFN